MKHSKVVVVAYIIISLFICACIGYMVKELVIDEETRVRWLAIGDSITYGENPPNYSYVEYISNSNDNILTQKRSMGGIGARELYQLIQDGYLDKSFQPDVITVLIGTNDFGFDVPLNEYDTYIDLLMKELRTIYPNSRIVFMTPLYRDYFGTRLNTVPSVVNNLGINLDSYRTVIRDKATSNGFDVIELSEEEFLNSNNIRELTSDGLHPNKQGNKMIADKLEKMLFYEV